MKSINAVAMTLLSTLCVFDVCLSASISNPDRFQHEGKLNAYLRSVYINTRISNELIEDRFGRFSGRCRTGWHRRRCDPGLQLQLLGRRCRVRCFAIRRGDDRFKRQWPGPF